MEIIEKIKSKFLLSVLEAIATFTVILIYITIKYNEIRTTEGLNNLLQFAATDFGSLSIIALLSLIWITINIVFNHKVGKI